MEAIKDIIPGVIGGWQTRDKSSAVSGNPEAVLKKNLTKGQASHIKFQYFRKGILGLCVDSPGWLYKINLEKEALFSRVSKDLVGLKEIKLRLGEIK
jgi:hypothetical protein